VKTNLRQEQDLKETSLFAYNTLFSPPSFGFFQSEDLEKIPVFFSHNNLVIVPEVPVMENTNLHITNLKVSSPLPRKPCSTLELHLWQTKELVNFLALQIGCPLTPAYVRL